MISVPFANEHLGSYFDSELLAYGVVETTPIGNRLSLMLADEFPEMDFLSPETIGGSPVTLSLDVENADDTVNAALAVGATVLRPVAEQFYGRRSGQVRDPFGHRWDISSLTEKLTDEEISQRAAKLFGPKEGK